MDAREAGRMARAPGIPGDVRDRSQRRVRRFPAHAADISISLLPGVEWSVYQQHVVAIGPVEALSRDSFGESTARMVRIFAASSVKAR